MLLATPSAIAASSSAALVFEQAIFGFLCGLGYPSAHKALAAARIKPTLRSTALSLVNSSAAWGSVAASLLTPLLVQLHWRAPFYCLTLGGLAAAAALSGGSGPRESLEGLRAAAGSAGAGWSSLLADLREAVAYLRAHPEMKPEGNAAVYGAAAAIPDAILEDVLRGYVDIKLKVKAKAPADGDGHNGHGHKNGNGKANGANGH